MNIDPYINDGQDPAVVEKRLLKIQDILDAEGEDVTYIAVQKKPAVTLFPDSIALTNKRVFICKPTKLGMAIDFDIIPWQDVHDLSFKECILGAQVTVVRHDGTEATVGYIPKNQARKLYKTGIEALRISALRMEKVETDGVASPPTAEPADELALKLKKLKTLFEQELITEAEYGQKKMELLSQL